jgi:hypothetical protein
MSAFENFVHFLQGTMETPTNFGVFHICCWIAVIAASVLLVLFFRNSDDRFIRKMLLGIWIVLVVLEIYKQLVFSMTVTDGVATWKYQWYAFPFQFCATPIYVLPFIVFLKDGKLRDTFIVFFACFTFFAGFVVMIYPNDVFTPMIGINVHTMIHHGAQVAVGIMLAARYRDKLVLRNLLGSFAIFAAFCAVATVLNEVVYAALQANGMDDSFNMFYFSRHYDCHLPILSDVCRALKGVNELFCDIVFPIIYIVGFCGVSALFFGIEKGIAVLAHRFAHAKAEETEE